MKLEQFYWGNNGDGYCFLNASTSQYHNTVENLCGSIGSRDVTVDFHPFVISVPQNGMLFMIYVQEGKKDQYQRGTLFFHIIAGDVQKCSEMGINAYSLRQKAFFNRNFETGNTPIEINTPLVIDGDSASEFAWDGSPAVIQSSCPEDALIAKLLGKRINDLPWAGFCYRMSDLFYLYAFPGKYGMPQDRACYTPTGILIQQPVAPEKESFSSVSPSGDPVHSKTHFGHYALLISVVLNVVLLLCCVFHSSPPPENMKEISKIKAENQQMKERLKKIDEFKWDDELGKTEICKNINETSDKDFSFLQKIKHLLSPHGKDFK